MLNECSSYSSSLLGECIGVMGPGTAAASMPEGGSARSGDCFLSRAHLDQNQE